MKSLLLLSICFSSSLAFAGEKRIVFEAAMTEAEHNQWNEGKGKDLYKPTMVCKIKNTDKAKSNFKPKNVYVAINGDSWGRELEGVAKDETVLLKKGAYLVFEDKKGGLTASADGLDIHLVGAGYEKMDVNNRSLSSSITNFGVANTKLVYKEAFGRKIEATMDCTTGDSLYTTNKEIKL